MEGQSFEKQHETPKPETGPEIDIESVLERGEIEAIEALKGHATFNVVRIKDDGEGLFKPNGEKVGSDDEKEENRAALELLAYQMDKILGFNLVPVTVSRQIQGRRGALQKFISVAIPAVEMNNWEEKISLDELTRASVFDYLIDAQDRVPKNFLIDAATGKIWLIDHDYYMFSEPFLGSRLVDEAKRKNLTTLSVEILTAVSRLIESVDALLTETDEDLMRILAGIKERAKVLLEQGKLPL